METYDVVLCDNHGPHTYRTFGHINSCTFAHYCFYGLGENFMEQMVLFADIVFGCIVLNSYICARRCKYILTSLCTCTLSRKYIGTSYVCIRTSEVLCLYINRQEILSLFNLHWRDTAHI